MATALSFISARQITNDSGTVQSGALLYFYREGTTTALTVWTDDAASVAHANPVVCDSGGFVPLIYIDDTYDYKLVIKTSGGVTLQTYDNIPAPAATSTTGYYPALLEWTTKTSAQSPVALAVADAGSAYLADTTGGDVEFDLPSAASIGNGKGFTFKKIVAANAMIIDPNGTETIDDSSTSVSLNDQYEEITIISDGAEWWQTSKFGSYVTAANIRDAVATVNGLTIENNSGTPTTSLDVNCDEAVLISSSGNGIRVGSQDLTIDATSTGANGLDTGSLANTTWYYVYIISNGTTTAALLSTSATSPTMPTGYTYKYRVGAIITGGAATFTRIIQKGARAHYKVVAASTTPNLPIMDSGANGSVSVPTWVAVAVGNYIPTAVAPIIRVGAHCGVGNSFVIIAPNNAYGARGSTSNPPVYQYGATSPGYGSVSTFDLLLESTNIYWASSTADGTLFCQGWVDAVNAN